MNKQSKLTRSAILFQQYESSFSCPLCHSAMKVKDLKSISCMNGHVFDFAKQGYLNLMTQQIQTNYNKALFAARRKVLSESTLFQVFSEEITKIINEMQSTNKHIKITDMGSGEGSHLVNIYQKLTDRFQTDVTGIGLDISKDGVIEATKHHENMMWIVADIKSTPLQDRTSDVILNILSPANYDEFNRLLVDDGILVKVAPRQGYLQELRQYFHQKTGQEDYSNEKVVNHFKGNFNLVKHHVVRYTESLDKDTLESLIRMTPLTWGIEEEKIQDFLAKEQSSITIDLDILVGKKIDQS